MSERSLPDPNLGDAATNAAANAGAIGFYSAGNLAELVSQSAPAEKVLHNGQYYSGEPVVAIQPLIIQPGIKLAPFTFFNNPANNSVFDLPVDALFNGYIYVRGPFAETRNIRLPPFLDVIRKLPLHLMPKGPSSPAPGNPVVNNNLLRGVFKLIILANCGVNLLTQVVNPGPPYILSGWEFVDVAGVVTSVAGNTAISPFKAAGNPDRQSKILEIYFVVMQATDSSPPRVSLYF
jgi:hypothetical protein